MKNLVFSSLWISLAAYVLTVASLSHLEGYILWWHPEALLNFGSTLLVYNIHNGIKSFKPIATERNLWNKANQKLILLLLILGLFLVVYSILQLQITLTFYYAILGIISLAYTLPLLLKQTNRKIIAIYGWIKPFYLAIIWWMVTYIVPSYSFNSYISSAAFIDGWNRLFILIILCITFDIKDIHQDKNKGIYTLAAANEKNIDKILSVIIVLLIFLNGLEYLLNLHVLNLVLIVYLFLVKKINKVQSCL